MLELSKEDARRIMSDALVETCSCGRPTLFYVNEDGEDGQTPVRKSMCRHCIAEWLRGRFIDLSKNYRNLDEWFPIGAKATLALEHQVRGPYTVWVSRGSHNRTDRKDWLAFVLIIDEGITNMLTTKVFAEPSNSFAHLIQQIADTLEKTDALPNL